jgi:hypothetical protein
MWPGYLPFEENLMNASLASSIVSYSSRYHQEMLSRYDPDRLLENWWAALDFFFGRACFQGRRDDISERVYQEVVAVLSSLFSGDERTANYQKERYQGWETVERELKQRIGKGKVGKARDVDMVLSALDFIGQLPALNIVSYSVERVQHGEIDEHYKELQRSKNKNGIIQVGPKIASFYLRDVVSLYHLGDKVPDEFAFHLQPVDVWVRKLAYKTEIVSDEASDREIQKAIVALCKEQGCSPLQFNQGAWYVGYFAFDLLLEILTEANGALKSKQRTA